MKTHLAILCLLTILATTTAAAQSNPATFKTMRIGDTEVGFLPKSVLEKITMERAPDGSFRIKPHSRPPELNELHRRYCASLGAEDITDEADVYVSLKDSDAVLCTMRSLPDVKHQGTPAVAKSISMPDGIIGYPIGPVLQINEEPESDLNRQPAPNLAQVLINLSAPSGTTPMNQNYTATGDAEYINMPKGGPTASILTVAEQSPLVVRALHSAGPGYFHEMLTGTVVATRPVALSTVTGCYSGTCAPAAHGTFRHF